MIAASEIIVRVLLSERTRHAALRCYLEERGDPDIQAQEIRRYFVAELDDLSRSGRMERAVLQELIAGASWIRVRTLLKSSLDQALKPQMEHIEKPQASEEPCAACSKAKMTKDVIYL